MAVNRKWVLPSGEVKEKLTPEEMAKFCQKVAKLHVPLAYEAVMKDLQKAKAV